MEDITWSLGDTECWKYLSREREEILSALEDKNSYPQAAM